MRTIILGFDAFDPGRFEEMVNRGQLPNLSRMVDEGGYSRFRVSNPPQSEVSWTSIATGLNPGDHGLFDFVHRNPRNYTPYLSLLPTEKKILGGIRFCRPSDRVTIFDEVSHDGYSATALWWPAMFPADYSSPVQVITGLGTPDIQGRLGVGTLYSSNPSEVRAGRRIPTLPLTQQGSHSLRSHLLGPRRKNNGGSVESTLEFALRVDPEGSGSMTFDRQHIALRLGEWSPIFETTFRVGRLGRVRCVGQAILTSISPVVLYVSPLQIHPFKSIWPLGSPRGFVKKLWKESGPFLTLGWPQDTTALEEECLNDSQFLSLCDAVFYSRRRVLLNQLRCFKEGLLATVFDSLDRVQHMFWSDRPDIVEQWYQRLDRLVGEVKDAARDQGLPEASIFVVSDHGFTGFEYKVHLNRWFLDHGYLSLRKDSKVDNISTSDWSSSQCFAVGLNSVYLNMAGREASGQVSQEQAERLVRKLMSELSELRGPNGEKVISRIWKREQAFSGIFQERAPDLVIGYSPGFRASSETGLGNLGDSQAVTPNADHWNADHCVDFSKVPGVLFSSRSLSNWSSPSYRDFPSIVIGKNPKQRRGKPTAPMSETDHEEARALQQRLESLGYL